MSILSLEKELLVNEISNRKTQYFTTNEFKGGASSRQLVRELMKYYPYSIVTLFKNAVTSTERE